MVVCAESLPPEPVGARQYVGLEYAKKLGVAEPLANPGAIGSTATPSPPLLRCEYEPACIASIGFGQLSPLLPPRPIGCDGDCYCFPPRSNSHGTVNWEGHSLNCEITTTVGVGAAWYEPATGKWYPKNLYGVASTPVPTQISSPTPIRCQGPGCPKEPTAPSVWQICFGFGAVVSLTGGAVLSGCRRHKLSSGIPHISWSRRHKKKTGALIKYI